MSKISMSKISIMSFSFVFVFLIVGCSSQQLSSMDQASSIADNVVGAADDIAMFLPPPISTYLGFGLAVVGAASSIYQKARKDKILTATKEIVKGVEDFKKSNSSSKDAINTSLDKAESSATKDIVYNIKHS